MPNLPISDLPNASTPLSGDELIPLVQGGITRQTAISNLPSGGGGGGVSSVSVVSANGLAGTVATPSTTPAITLTTTVNGIAYGDGTLFGAVTVGSGLSFASGTLSNTGAPATSGSSLLYGNGAGGFSSVTIGSGLSFAGGTLTNTGAPATTGSSILYGNGAGGFSNVTIGSGLTFSGGTLSSSGGGSATWATLGDKTGASGPSIISLGQNSASGGAGSISFGTSSSATDAGVAIGQETTSIYGGVSIGLYAGKTNPEGNIVAIGESALEINADFGAVGIGYWAAKDTAGLCAISIGAYAGQTTQGSFGIAIGNYAAYYQQAAEAIAIGDTAGEQNQGTYGVGIGYYAGRISQGASAVAIGRDSGVTSQGANAVAIGRSAGTSNQGTNAVAIGLYAGTTSQANNSIVINATGSVLNNSTANSLKIAPIRSAAAAPSALYYDETTQEVTYGPSIAPIGGFLTHNVLSSASYQFVQASPSPGWTSQATTGRHIYLHSGSLKSLSVASSGSTSALAGYAAASNGLIACKTWFFMPAMFRKTMTFSYVGMDCVKTSAGSTASTIQILVYSDNSGVPGTLLYDWGTAVNRFPNGSGIGYPVWLTGTYAFEGFKQYWIAVLVDGTAGNVSISRINGVADDMGFAEIGRGSATSDTLYKSGNTQAIIGTWLGGTPGAHTAGVTPGDNPSFGGLYASTFAIPLLAFAT